MARIVIDAKDAIIGRLAAAAARLAKVGNEVIVVNCEEAVISGNKTFIEKRYWTNMHRGTSEDGPYQPKRPDRLVRRMIRDMMDYKGFQGKKDFARVKTFIGIPDEYAKEVAKEFNVKKSSDLINNHYVKLGEVCKSIGGRW